MTEWLPLAFAFVAGLLLSAFYFGGLWWTVRRGVVAEHPALWFAGSMLLRTSIVLVGFHVVGRGHWERLMVCLLGFVMARVFVTLRLRSRLRLQASARQAGQAWRTRSALDVRARPAQEAGHAP
jgi:F1F0 ATPase subunit 2